MTAAAYGESGGGRRRRARTAVGAAAVFLVVVVGAWLAVQSQGGPVQGSAETAKGFVDSFPQDWGCESQIMVNWQQAYVVCDELKSQYFWWPYGTGEAMEGIDLDASGCVAVSGKAMGISTDTARHDEVEAVQGLIDSFAETPEVHCP